MNTYIIVRYSHPSIGIPKVYFIGLPGGENKDGMSVFRSKEQAQKMADQLSKQSKHYHEVVERWDWKWS